MNQTELTAKVAESVDLEKAQVGLVVDAVLGAVADALKAGEKVSLQSLGIFDIADRAARQGRNPATGETIDIAATKVVKFRPAKALKDAVSPPAASKTPAKPAKPAAKKPAAKK